MNISLLEIGWYSHYKIFALLKIESVLSNWTGHLIRFEWYRGEIMWDFMFLNSNKRRDKGQ